MRETLQYENFSSGKCISINHSLYLCTCSNFSLQAYLDRNKKHLKVVARIRTAFQNMMDILNMRACSLLYSTNVERLRI
jgi:hypothetical protein